MIEQTEISVTIPAHSRFVALTRVIAASLAAELDFTIDEIADIRVGADELTSLLIEWAEDHDIGAVEIRYCLSGHTLEIEAAVGSGEAGEPRPEAQTLDSITKQILAAVVDSFEIEGGRGRIVKHRASS
jgi:anti-sigma regulatory factor (Ser/Thr protein kinase)